MDCMRAAQPRQQFQWTPDKDQLLQQNVLRWGDDNWSTVAFHTSPHLNATQAATRYNRLNQKSGRWSPTEDRRLREAHRLFEGAYMADGPLLEFLKAFRDGEESTGYVEGSLRVELRIQGWRHARRRSAVLKLGLAPTHR